MQRISVPVTYMLVICLWMAEDPYGISVAKKPAAIVAPDEARDATVCPICCHPGGVHFFWCDAWREDIKK